MGGYSYTWGTTDEAIWLQKRNELALKMNFATGEMAAALGLEAAVSPFLEPSFIEWVTTSTGRAECVGEMPIELSPTTERIMHITGKVCLRNAFPESPAAHRRKDPIEMGSGATDLNVSKGGAAFFGVLLDMDQTPEGLLNFEMEQKRVLCTESVVIKDLEHLYYYRTFLKAFPLEDSPGALLATPLGDLGEGGEGCGTAAAPDAEPGAGRRAGRGVGIERFTVDACVGCGYKLRKPDDMFCYVCGAWPARITT